MEKNKKIMLIKQEQKATSKQQDLNQNFRDLLEPNLPFIDLIRAYENSFIIWWIVDKIATSWNSWFIKTEDKKLDDLLDELDVKFIIENLFVCWNAFLEIIKNWKWEVVELEPILTHTIRKKRWWGYKQIWLTTSVDFEEDEVLHIKLWSLQDKIYGESKLSKCVTQIVLLAYIDQYYENFFNNSTIKPNVLIDKNDSLDDNQKEALKTLIKEHMVWVKNSFATAIVPCELEKLDLWTDIDTKAFLDFRKELKEDIAICLNIPYDLLSSQNSNRSTSEVAIETLNKDIIKPLQKNISKYLKKSLQDSFKNTDKIEFISIDISNQLEESKIEVAYKKAGIKTANEVREKLWLAKIDGWDILETSNNKFDSDEDEIEKNIKKIYEEYGK